MKRLSVVAVVMLMSFAAVFANNVEPKNLDSVKKTLVNNLKMENAGVRQSTLHVIAKIHADFPNADLSDLNNALLKVAKNDAESYIRISANLTYTYINSAELAAKVKIEDSENPAVFFSSLYKEVNEEFFNFAD